MHPPAPPPPPLQPLEGLALVKVDTCGAADRLLATQEECAEAANQLSAVALPESAKEGAKWRAADVLVVHKGGIAAFLPLGCVYFDGHKALFLNYGDVQGPVVAPVYPSMKTKHGRCTPGFQCICRNYVFPPPTAPAPSAPPTMPLTALGLRDNGFCAAGNKISTALACEQAMAKIGLLTKAMNVSSPTDSSTFATTGSVQFKDYSLEVGDFSYLPEGCVVSLVGTRATQEEDGAGDSLLALYEGFWSVLFNPPYAPQGEGTPCDRTHLCLCANEASTQASDEAILVDGFCLNPGLMENFRSQACGSIAPV